MKIIIDSNNSLTQSVCRFCENWFELDNPQPIIASADGKLTGDVCPECFALADVGRRDEVAVRIGGAISHLRSQIEELQAIEAIVNREGLVVEHDGQNSLAHEKRPSTN